MYMNVPMFLTNSEMPSLPPAMRPVSCSYARVRSVDCPLEELQLLMFAADFALRTKGSRVSKCLPRSKNKHTL